MPQSCNMQPNQLNSPGIHVKDVQQQQQVVWHVPSKASLACPFKGKSAQAMCFHSQMSIWAITRIPAPTHLRCPCGGADMLSSCLQASVTNDKMTHETDTCICAVPTHCSLHHYTGINITHVLHSSRSMCRCGLVVWVTHREISAVAASSIRLWMGTQPTPRSQLSM